MSALTAEICREIRQEGPMTVARYMDLCLAHPKHGYYRTRDPLGRGGDFTTAPEISQMFGEILGLWAAQVWLDMGAPGDFALVELGPGRGTLMADALRATRIVPGFVEAAHIHLVETSNPLRAAQAANLESHTDRTRWHDRIDTLPNLPVIAIANEFFDALPIRQFQWTGLNWHERLVGLDDNEDLCFGLSPEPVAASALPTPPPSPETGAIAETCPPGLEIMAGLSRKIAVNGCAALIVDYGYEGPAAVDTFQALAGHAFAPVLESPGAADLTAHVDFTALGNAAQTAGARVWGPVGQGDFLRALGIRERAAALKSRATENQSADIDTALDRLTSAGGMGDLFRVIAVSSPGTTPPPPFDNGQAT